MRAASTDQEFRSFVLEAEPVLRRALIAGFGPQRGRDATADALAYAWENWEKVRVMQNPNGYLYRVGQTAARRSLRRPRPVFPEPPGDRVPLVEPGLPKALEKLSPRQRQAVTLVHGYGWTHKEAADLLGLSSSAVQNHVERGLAKLRASLKASIGSVDYV